jgi:YVTN family beta-propeller protein
MLRRGLLLAILVVMPTTTGAQPAAAPLTLEGKIPLGDVSGRIDHLAVDLKRQRLFVAELGNDSLGVVDLAAGKVLATVAGLSQPQGVGYEPTTDTVYVANAGDGSVRVLQGRDLAPLARIDLGDDADNVRIDPQRRRVLVGFGKGAIAIVDPAGRAKMGEYPLNAHPESFQIDETGARVFANVPDRHEIAIVDLAGGSIRTVPTGAFGGNFPMAIDRDAHRVLVGLRSPPTLLALANRDGSVAGRLDICGDADDIFVDPTRHRIYVTCGAGAIDVIEPREEGYAHLAKVPTGPGARTGLFVPEWDRLYVAVRAAGPERAAIWVFRPTP